MLDYRGREPFEEPPRTTPLSALQAFRLRVLAMLFAAAAVWCGAVFLFAVIVGKAG